jgi:predicted HTH transcriptional regulator
VAGSLRLLFALRYNYRVNSGLFKGYKDSRRRIAILSKHPETNRIEYKRELNDKLERSVVAFLNYDGGGEILFGVDDDGSAVGLADVDGDQLKIVDRLKNNIRPKILGLFDVVPERREGKFIIRVVVSSGMQKPYYIRGKGMTETGCFIRVGSSVQPMTEQMIEDFLAKRQKVSLATTISPNQALTFEQLKIYYQEHNLRLNEEFLNNLDLRLSTGKYNYAAYLLSDSNGASIRVAKYAGMDKVDLIENEEYGYRCLITAAYRVLDKLLAENRTFAKITYPKRLEKDMVDKTALREAAINALVHNDYSMNEPVIEIFADRISITSYGGLVEGMTREDFFNCRSMPRNRELMRIFKDVELVERLGSGMTRILKAYDRSIFELTPNFLVVTFPFAKGFNSNDGNTTDSVSDRVKDRVKDRVSDRVNETQRDIMLMMEKNPKITAKELSDNLKINERNVRNNIRSLKKSGLIGRVGSDKTGYWEIKR